MPLAQAGFEEDVVRAVRDHCTGMSLTNDAMNNVYARIGGNANGKKPGADAGCPYR